MLQLEKNKDCAVFDRIKCKKHLLHDNLLLILTIKVKIFASNFIRLFIRHTL